MTNQNPDRLRLHALIIDEASRLRGFVDLLVHEEQLLIDGQADALMPVADDKNQRYRQLQKINDDRTRLLARLGLQQTDAIIRALCQDAPAALAAWDAVLKLAREARDRNQRNGVLIVERMQHNQAALSTLLAAANQPQLYGPDGQSRPAGGGRSLGSV
ncbi:flagellar protein FlgN [Zoogloeaceae bacterium G21618-S1]|nr:flagellar protein FlgN [Zoogloeaceae bacterium G21618-S1]